MKITRIIIAVLSALLLSVSCDVHEFPDVPATRKHCLRLHYETDLPIWHWDYTLQSGLTSKNEEIMTKSVMDRGQMRYIIRTYPKSNGNSVGEDYIQEFVFTRNVSDGYDTELELDIIPGDYRMMVWSDLIMPLDDRPFYNYGDFSRIRLQGEHRGNTDYRDAFRGFMDFTLDETILEAVPDTSVIEMIRPLAKFEFLSNDLENFIEMEVKSALSKAEATDTKVDTKIDINEYNVKVIYPAFMPNTYSMFTDKPVDSATGVSFESGIRKVSDGEASMGFDYVFVGEKQSAVTVQLAIYNKDGEQISLTVPVDVPLKRGYHTLLRGTFLTQKASGGIGINPDFSGDHNIIL